jgi:hypothetical protein
MDRPTVRLTDGRRAEIIRYGGNDRYHAIIRQCSRERLPAAKVTIRRDGDAWAVVREAAVAQAGSLGCG